MKFEYSRQILKITQISKFMEIHAVGAQLFHADGRTDGPSDMMEPIVTVRNFAMRLKIPAVYLKRTKSADCIWIYTVQHEVSVLKLTAFS
jgi:hypothetical protein